MIALVDHRLGEVERGYAGAFEERVVEQSLVHARPFAERRTHHVLERGENIVRRQHRIFRSLPHAVRAMAQHVSQRTHEHAHLAVEGAHAAERLHARRRRIRMFDKTEAAGIVDEQRQRRIRCQRRRQYDRARTRAAAAMRRRECLVQIDVHSVDAEIAGTHPARNGVEIRAVAIEISARLVHFVGDFLHALLEETAGVGVRQHDRSNVRPELGFQRVSVDMPVVPCRDFVDGEAGQRRRCRICAVRRRWHEDTRAMFAARLQRRTDRQQAAEFAMRACLRAHGDSRHAGQRRQPVHQVGDERQRTLHRLLRLQRMDIAESRQTRHLLVETRIVLHRARAERIKSRIDRVVHA